MAQDPVEDVALDPDEDEVDGETAEEIQRWRASMPQRFSGANWQTVGAAGSPTFESGFFSSVVPSTTAVGFPSQASYVNAAQVLATTTSN